MSRQETLAARAKGFRSDLYRKLYKEGIKQNFEPGRMPTGHLTLKCPKCGFIEQFSTTGKGVGHESKKKISSMRRHGLAWGGAPGKHAVITSGEGWWDTVRS